MSSAEVMLYDVVRTAIRDSGVGDGRAELLRNGSNAMFLVPGGIVARVGRPGRLEAAAREVRVSLWLTEHGIAANRALPELPQPVLVGDRPVTWWSALPPHRPGTPAELGGVLQELHALPPPDFPIPVHDPFDGLDDLASTSAAIGDGDRQWLSSHVQRLRAEHSQFGNRRPMLIHGDAWQGNLAVVDGEAPILLDFEKVSNGDRSWDLVQIAVDHTDFSRIDAVDYRRFVDAYGGVDVTDRPEYGLYSAVQELRWVGFMLAKADEDPRILVEGRHRLACLRGEVSRPWTWTAL